MRVEEIQRDEREAVLDTLCEAFYDYPFMTYSLAQSGASYGAHLRVMINLFCENRWGRDQPLYAIRKDNEIVAVAVCSGAVSVPSTLELKRLKVEFDEMVGRQAVERLARYDELCEIGEPDCPHHYLGMLGVRNELRGQGYSRILVDRLKQIVRDDDFSEGICLNTEHKANLPIYERLGFEIIAEAEHDEIHTWCHFWKSNA